MRVLCIQTNGSVYLQSLETVVKSQRVNYPLDPIEQKLLGSCGRLKEHVLFFFSHSLPPHLKQSRKVIFLRSLGWD